MSERELARERYQRNPPTHTNTHTHIQEVITESYASFGVSKGAAKEKPPIGMFLSVL